MGEFVKLAARRADLAENIVWVLVGVAGTLLVGSILRIVSLLRRTVPRSEFRSRIGSLATWWVLYSLLVLVAVLGSGTAVALFACVSLVGLREFERLAGGRIAVASLWWTAYLAVPVHYLFVYLERFGPFWTFIPVWVFFILLARLAIMGQTVGFLETAGIVFVGLMLIVFLFSHAVLLLALPDEVNPTAGPIGLFLYLILMTEGNDIAQALWGRRFGRRRIAPAVSPNKTWEGFLLGTATTIALGFILAGFLTPFRDRPFRIGRAYWHGPFLPTLAAGALIAVGGFLGDITMSAVKREVGVKDSGTLLPGQGGILDRIDSLTFTAPVFFYFVYVFYG